VVPSLADGPTSHPYAKLRDPEVVEHLKAALIGRLAMWSGSPDQGATNRAMKDALIQNLAGWAGGAFAAARGPGLVALLDASASTATRYDWVRAITPVPVVADPNLLIYSAVRALDPRATAILTSGAGPIAYDNMATFGFQVPNGAPGVSLDAVGQTGTTQGGQVVLLTMEAGNAGGALVQTDTDDYPPGTTVTITGSGWEPGETVKLTLHMDPLRDSDTELTAVADGNGRITNTQYSPTQYDVYVRYVLTATGLTSGRRAQTTFTDAPRVGSVSVGAQSGTATYGTAGAVTFAVTSVRSANGTVNGTYSVTAGLPAGVTASFAPATFTANGGTAFPGSTLTLTTTAAALPGSYAFTVRLADGADSARTTASLVISPRTVTGSFTAANKVYDGTDAASIVTRSLTGVIVGDVVSLSGGTATFATKNVGIAKTVTGTGFSLSGGDAAKYTLASTTLATTADITARALAVTGTGVNKVYDGTTAATVTLSDDRIVGDVITTSFTAATFADKNVGTGKSINVTGIAISGADAGNYTANTSCTAVADITPKSLTGSFTADNKVYDGTTAATISGRSLSPLPFAGDVASLTGGTATFDTKHVGTGKTVTGTGFSLTGADAGNYALASSSLTTTASITARVLIISATGVNKVYDGTTAATVSLTDDRVSGDVITVTYSSALYADKNVGTTKPVSVTGVSITGADAGNYTFNTTASTTADITARALAISATGVNKVYDGTTAAMVTLADDRVAGDAITTSFTSAVFTDKNVGTGKTITVTGISISGTDAGNYTFNTSTTTTANITSRALAVTATGINKVYDGTTAATVTLADDRIAGDAFTANYASATFSDKNVGAGKTVSVGGISLSGADAGNYTPNTSTTTIADITARALTITALGVNKVYDATTAATVTLSDDRVGGDVFTDSYTTATFADKNVGTGKSISVTGISISGADAGNYTFNTTATAAANITAATLIGTFTANDKVYDGSATATIATRNVSGTLLTDVVSLTGGTAAFDNKNVGTNKTVTGTGFTLGGADAGNYALQSTTLTTTASITARALTVTATGVNKVYDATATATVTLSDDRVAGDVFTDSYAAASFNNKNVGTAKPVNVTGIAITGADAGNYTFNTTASTTADITSFTLTGSFTAANKVYDGTAVATILTRNVAVVFAGDDVSLTGGSATFVDKNVGVGKTVNGSGFTLTGSDAGNYVLASASLTTTANVTARALTITANGVNKVYDGTTAGTVNLSDDRVSGDVFADSYASATFADKNVGTAKPVTVTGISISGTDAGNYTFNTTASTTADITARGLAVTATGINKVYDGTTVATVTLSDDRVAGDVFTTAYTAAAFSDKNAGTGKSVTVTGISISGTDAGNYTFNTSTTTTGDITPRALAIGATGVNKIYDGTTTATVTLADNRVSGDVLTDSYASASFSDKNVGVAKPVSVTGISISGADAGNYTFNTSASTTADITQRALTITATGVSRTYDGTTNATVTLSDNRVGGDVFTDSYTSASFTDKNAGTGKTINVIGISISGADAGNYSFNTTATTTADVTPATVTGSFTAANKVYDGTVAASISTRSLGGIIAPDVVTLAGGSPTFADKNVGAGKTVTGTGFTLGGADASNYALALTTLTTTADITPRALLVNATGVNKVYDATAGATVNLSDNRVAGDAITTSYTTASFVDANVGNGKSVSVSGISISGADAANYTFNTTTSTTANITPRPLTIKADDKNMNFGSAPPAFTVTPNNFAPGEGFANLTGTVQYATTPVDPITTTTFAGNYTITPSGVSGSNYTVTFQTGTLTIVDGSKPVVSNTLVPPVQIGGTVVLTSSISDEFTGHTNISSAWYSINGGPLQAMTATDGSFDSFKENVKATIVAPTTTGVFTVCVTGRDALPPANVSDPECVLLAVYDPNSGFVTGGGWIDSPAGAYVADPSLKGKATFGFVSKYKKGQSTPDGSTEFQFHAAGMNFKSTVYEWLVVAGAKAQFKGSGTINGAGNFGFILTAIDGQISGGGGADKFRIKIWDKNNGDAVVYDNQMLVPDTADPTTLLGGGSINIQAK
jgi:hypothetical protein